MFVNNLHRRNAVILREIGRFLSALPPPFAKMAISRAREQKRDRERKCWPSQHFKLALVLSLARPGDCHFFERGGDRGQ